MSLSTGWRSVLGQAADMAGVRTSPYERLVDRWIDLATWSTAEKTVLAMGVAVVFHTVVGVLSVRAFGWAPGVLDAAGVVTMYAAFVVASAVILAVAFVAARRGHEGRWTVYLLIILYGGVLVWALWTFGTASSPWLGVGPLVALLVPVFFDRRAGRFALAYLGVGLVVVSLLELSGTIRFAPFVRDRAIDAQRTPGWYLGVYGTVLSMAAYVFLLVDLNVAARERQQERLATALHELGQARETLERGMRLIRRYVPAQVAEQILSGRLDGDGSYERRTLTICFTDIENFTQMVDQIEPEHASRILNEYLSEMTVIAERCGGTVDKFVGDAVMVLFGAPGDLHRPEHTMRAVEMALAMQARTAELAKKWFDEGVEVPFRARIGINTGPASVGNFGSTGRMDYTAIGKQVNVAARVQAHCPAGAVLVTHSTWALVKERFDCAPLGDVTVKGIHHPIRVYEVRGSIAPA
jgi:class 3 adenylate cyclase